MLSTQIAYATDRGPRENLEDAAVAFELNFQQPEPFGLSLALGCDGVGGNEGGELASNLGASSISSSVAGSVAALVSASDGAPLAPEFVPGLLAKAFRRANRRILEEAEKDPRRKGMATTAVCAVLTRSMLHLAWVGDSPCYLIRGDEIRKLTRDHSQVQELLDDGLITPEQAEGHPFSGVITRYLGMEGKLDVDARSVPVRGRDMVLLCTDGLTDVLSDREIIQAVHQWGREGHSLGELPHHLIRQAIASGTTDNIAVLCCLHGSEPEPVGFTLTGDYPGEIAPILHSLHQEARI